MPTPVSNARACLAADAAAALDDAVAVARRRAHAQTTSLHVVYSLLNSSSSSSPSTSSAAAVPGVPSASCSILRDALSRARSSAYTPRLQFRALELCFGVALDRLPSSSSSGQRQAGEGGGEEPPVSNSLMAAIKRSQANQRRNPETFHLYQQQQQQSTAAGGTSSSFSGVKVELQQLMLAILDDPVVSRVFGDAGFTSTDIKLAILRPPPPFPRAARCPPLFLCNFSAGDGFEPALAPRGLVFPFARPAGQLSSDGGDGNCRRIGEILARKGGGRNPILVGVGASEAARDFARAVERQNWSVLPPELRGIALVSIENIATELRTGSGDQSAIYARLEDLLRKPESPGVVVNIEDLKGMAEGSAELDEKVSCLVSELTRLLEVYRGRVWVMGWSATYETYMKFLSRHPLLDKDWNLQLLPITSVRTGTGGSPPIPPSLMDSFVPFGGCFPIAYESKDIFSSASPSVSRCEHCNDRYEQEVSIILKGQSASVDDQQNASLPFWLRKANMVSLSGGLGTVKAIDDKAFLNAKIMELQKKWNENCQRLHRSCQTTRTDNCPSVPCTINPSHVSNNEKTCYQNCENLDATQKQRGFGISFPTSVGTPKITTASQSNSLPLVLEQGNNDLLSKLQVRPSRSEQLQREGFQSHQGDDHASPSSVTSVLTDLVLGTLHEPLCKEENLASQVRINPFEESSGCLPSIKFDIDKMNAPDVPVESISCSDRQDSQAKSTYPIVPTHSFSKVSNGCASAFDKPSLISSRTRQKFDLRDYKSFSKTLIDKVGRQEEAALAVSQAIVHCKNGERRHGSILRGDFWFSFHGPDKFGKKRVAVALAELIYGSKENFVSINLSYQDGVARPSTICAQQEANENDAHFRGKMNVDLIAEELRKKPQSIVFLENMDKADFLVQNSLSQAIHTGKFPDSHGRESSINNAIFILSSATTHGQTFSQGKDCINFSEEAILAAQCWQMRIFIEPTREAISSSPNANKVSLALSRRPMNSPVYLRSVSASKRKLDVSDDCKRQDQTLMSAKRAHTMSKAFLDLNLPVEDIEANDDDSFSHEDHSKSENSEAWMEDFFDLVDASVNFRPFDFDGLADSILKDISKIFCGAVTAVSSECLLEIDQKVMEEILAVAWSLEDGGALNDWFEQVLGRSFIELRHRYNLSGHNILRLVAARDALVEEHAPGVLLPSRIILN